MRASLTTLIYQSFNGLRYIDCLANDHVINILDAGRSSVSQTLKITHNDFV